MSNELSALSQQAIQQFWHNQAAQSKRPVILLTEVNTHEGGSLVAEIENRFVIWEAWGVVDAAVIASTCQSMITAAERAIRASTKLSGFYDFTRVSEFAPSGRDEIIRLRERLEGRLAPARNAVVFGSTMTRIMYDMANLLKPTPYEERVFPNAEEALIWLQDPLNTPVLDIDGFSWVLKH